jgi:signal transduction histidine kinase
VSWRSVRVRLTVLVVGVAAGAMVLAATLGVNRIQTSLIDDVLRETAEQSIFLDGILLESGLDQEGLGGPIDGPFFEEEMGFLTTDLENLVGDLDRIGVLDDLLAEFGRTRDDGLPILTAFGVIAIAGIDGAPSVFVDEDFREFGAPVAYQFNLDELVFSGIDVDMAEVFEQADESGFFDEDLYEQLVDQALVEQASSMEVAFGVEEFESIEFVIAADVADVNRSVDRIRSVLWVTMPLLLLAAAVATWILTGRSLSPVRRMSRQVDVISGGTLHERVPVPSTGDEIEELGTTMNRMLDRIEADDRRLRQFVSDASHELRSPVAVLRSEAEVALLAPETTGVEELAEGVLGESLRLERIVADLLVLARGDEARTPANVSVVDLDDIVLTEAARRRRVDVDTRSVSAGRVRGTREGGTRIVAHLLDNAARHADSRVSVGLQRDGSMVTLWVDDDGPGIPAEDRSRVFERFTRLESARRRDTGGAGLGLAVVAATVSAMGGNVTIEDSPLGGARFIVRVPAAP